MKYRMYVDEVGNADTRSSDKPEQRYLSLTGIAFELEYADSTLVPWLATLKRTFFNSHADEPAILHRKDIMAKKPPFESLSDPQIDARFRTELLGLIEALDFVVFTATIDKLEHRDRYKAWRYDPYHYCLAVLIERYVQWLEQQSGEGDIMIESRGDKEDKRLRAEFGSLYTNGTDYVRPEIIQARLTSRELKVKQKITNIAGLQLADLLAYPAYRVALCRRQNRPLPQDLNGRIGQILEDEKCYRSPSGRIEGWGRKWLP